MTGAKRLGLLSLPPADALDAHYTPFFRESGGNEVVKLHRIDCPNTLAIARVDEPTIRDRIAGIAGQVRISLSRSAQTW